MRVQNVKKAFPTKLPMGLFTISLILISLCECTIQAQTATTGSCYSTQAVAPPTPLGTGQPASNASIRVCNADATGTPCYPLATDLYTDADLTMSITSQPFSADSNGWFSFCSSSGGDSYLVQVTPQSGTVYSYQLTLNGIGTVITGNKTFVGNVGVTGNVTATGQLSGTTAAIGSTSQFSVDSSGDVATSGSSSVGSSITLSPLASGVDATSFINNALSSYDSVVLSPGTYPITCTSTTDAQYRSGGIRPSSNRSLKVMSGAEIVCAVDTTGYYNAIALQDVSNVNIEINGTLEGNRTADLTAGASSTAQHGFGVVFAGCQHCSLTGTGTIQNFLGDGVIIDKDWVSSTMPSDIYIGPILATNSYRNAVSVINLSGVATLDGTRLTNSNGTAPQAGIDIEPGYASNAVDTVNLIGVNALGNTGRGFEVQAPSGEGTVNSVQVLGGVYDSNEEGIEAYGTALTHLSVYGAKITNNVQCGSFVESTANGAVDISNNWYWGNATGTSFADCPSSNAYFITAAGFRFSGNTVRAGTNTNLPVAGLQLNSNTGVNQIYNNDLAGSAATTTASAEFNTYGESSSDYYSQNRLTTGQQQAQNLNIDLSAYATLSGTNTWTGQNTFSSSATSSNPQWVFAYESSLGTGNSIGIGAGTSGYSAYNGGDCYFKNVGGTGSTSNTWNCGIYGAGVLSIDGLGDVTAPGTLTTAASTTTAAGLVLPHGVAATTPVNGAVWTTTSGLYAQINGSTVGPYIAASNGAAGFFRNLILDADGSDTYAAAAADYIVLASSTGASKIVTGVSASCSTTSTGVNGLDTGTIAESTWYSIWVINNGTTTACLLSISSTTPTLPSGYTYYSRVGWIRTGATTSYYPLAFIQHGRKVAYKVTGNVAKYPIMASGSSGSPSTPTWTAVSTANYIPTTASMIDVGAGMNTGTSQLIVAPSSSYGAYSSLTNPPPIVLTTPATGFYIRTSTWMEIENTTTYIYYASTDANGILYCIGWEDNL